MSLPFQIIVALLSSAGGRVAIFTGFFRQSGKKSTFFMTLTHLLISLSNNSLKHKTGNALVSAKAQRT